MNKKLFALMMVPVVVVMGGTFAFSAWSGSANAFFGQSAATVGYTETLTFDHTNAQMTPLKISYNGDSVANDITSSTGTYTLTTQTGNAASTINVFANVSNLLPGDYAQFTVKITNKGTAVLNASTIEWNTVAYNANGVQFTNSASINALQPPVGPMYLKQVVQNGISNIPATSSHVFFLFNATGPSTTSGLLNPGNSITYNVYAILASSAPPTAAGQTLHLAISVPVSTLQ